MSEFTSKAYFDFIAEGKIKGSYCQSCGASYLPPRPLCPQCGESKMNWKDFENEGVIQSYTVVKVPLSRMEGLHPYTVVVVTLDDGPRISGLLLDVDEGEKISVGDRVMAEFIGDGEEMSLRFKLLD